MSDTITNAYKKFIEKNGYIPEMFNPYNCSEITDIAPTLTSACGITTCSGCVLIAEGNFFERSDENK